MRVKNNNQPVMNKLDAKRLKKKMKKKEKKLALGEKGAAMKNNDAVKTQEASTLNKTDTKLKIRGKKISKEKLAIPTDDNEDLDVAVEMQDTPAVKKNTPKVKGKKKLKEKLAKANIKEDLAVTDTQMDSDKHPSIPVPHMQEEQTHMDRKSPGQDTSEGGMVEREYGKTVYVGNVSINTTRKTLIRFFTKYGKVKNVRLRGAAVPDSTISKRAAIITGNFNPKRTSMIAYVTFAEDEMADKAEEANGAELDGKHLHVHKETQTVDHSKKHAVFIGCLPYDAEDEELRSHFAECGDIESVRIIRNRESGLATGCGFVNFKNADAIEIALQKNGTLFMKRNIRVMRYQNNPKSKAASRRMPGKRIGKAIVQRMPERRMGNTRGQRMPERRMGNTRGQRVPERRMGKAINQNVAERRMGKGNKMKVGRADFSGKKVLETRKFKKMRKARQMPNKEDRMKRRVAHQLQA